MTAAIFEEHRGALLGLAYRMLGDFARAEELVQEAWLRWSERRDAVVDAPKSYLIQVVTRLCLNELASARVRKEEARGDRLPEPISFDDERLARIEMLDRVSMAFLVLLQRLTAAERAALLLHDVFDFDHREIAELIQKSEAACRQLLRRARAHVARERRTLSVSKGEHERLLGAFAAAATTGDVAALSAVLSEDAVLTVDAGPDGGHFGPVRNLPGPLFGKGKVAAFVAAVGLRGMVGVQARSCELNGQPAIVLFRDDAPITAITVSVVDGRIRSVFMQADPRRLRYVGCVSPSPHRGAS